jgi:hypothetical protein
MAEEMTTESLIEDFKKFEKASYKKYKSLYEQIKVDRKFIAGSQNDDTDSTLIGDDVPRCSMNITQNAIRTIVNTYIPNQFKWHFEAIDGAAGGTDKMNKMAEDFLTDVDNATAAIEALTNSVGTALGVLIFSDDYDVDGTVKPVLYSLSDVTNVRLDPNATKLNFADAKRAAIVELKTKEWLRRTYGDLPFLMEYSDRPLIDISETYDRKMYVPLVTYYVKDDEHSGVTCYKLLGDRVIDDPRVLPYSYIPVVPVFGEATWTKDDKPSWSGITTLVRPIQRLVNYSYRQLILRCAKSPKNTWVADGEAIENNEQYYKNSDKTLNPLLIYNRWSKDGKRELAAPVRLPNDFQIQDTDQLMQNALSLMNSVIGIPATGLETDVQKTATEVLTNNKIFNNNIRCYIQHLKNSMQLIGVLFADYNYQQPMYGKIKVSMVAGPDEEMKKQEARVQLQSFLPLVATDQDKQKLLLAQCAVEDDNQYIQLFAQMLSPSQTPLEAQQQELLQQANGEIKTRDAQIAELNSRIKDMETDQKIQSYSLDRELIKAKQAHLYKMEEMRLEAELKGENPEVEQVKSDAEIAKAQMSVEKEAIALQREEIKAAQPAQTEQKEEM